MRRLSAGESYNIATSRLVARATYLDFLDDDGRLKIITRHELYRTSGGAFFLVSTTIDERRRNYDGEFEVYTTMQPMRRDEAIEWVYSAADIELIADDIIPAPPEAAEAE